MSSRDAQPATVFTSNDIDEALIERVVRSFYGRVQADAVLGSIFHSRISDWEPHLQRMFAFWSSVTLGSGRYSVSPCRYMRAAHRRATFRSLAVFIREHDQ